MLVRRRKNRVSDCPLTAALAAVGGKWKLIIIYSLAERPYRFAEIRDFLGNVSPKVLTEQLGELIADDIVSREETGPPPAPVVYSITEYGRSVQPLIDFVKVWGKRHIERVASQSSLDSEAGIAAGEEEAPRNGLERARALGRGLRAGATAVTRRPEHSWPG